MSPASNTVLLAEDDTDIREVLSDLLRDSGYTVIAVANGRDGMIEARRLDGTALVVMDLSMPILTGYDMLDQMRADPALRQLKVLVISASPDASRLGGIPTLRKPFEVDDFMAAVERAFAK